MLYSSTDVTFLKAIQIILDTGWCQVLVWHGIYKLRAYLNILYSINWWLKIENMERNLRILKETEYVDVTW